MLRCRDGSLYTGWTNDMEQRLKTHQAGKGGKYTRSRLPVELVYVEVLRAPETASESDLRSAALRREAAIKKMRPAAKRALIDSDSNFLKADS